MDAMMNMNDSTVESVVDVRNELGDDMMNHSNGEHNNASPSTTMNGGSITTSTDSNVSTAEIDSTSMNTNTITTTNGLLPLIPVLVTSSNEEETDVATATDSIIATTDIIVDTKGTLEILLEPSPVIEDATDLPDNGVMSFSNPTNVITSPLDDVDSHNNNNDKEQQTLLEVADTAVSDTSNNNDSNNKNNNDMIINALQENLQNQMHAKAEAEDKLRKMEYKVRILEEQIQKQAQEMLQYDTIQENLQLQMTAKAEAEHKARTAYDKVQQLETQIEKYTYDMSQIQQQLTESQDIAMQKDRELDQVRKERDDYQRNVTVLTTRLNAAKKLEAVKVNHVDDIEDDLKATSQELQQVKLELEQNKLAKHQLEQQLQYVEKVSLEQIELLEHSLNEQKRINEERKMKMKEYVEKKTEELKQVQEENESLQIELTQTNRSLVELNTRWKQIHTQWVQAQTRNRELQRDLQRTKKDSEHLHKQGDTLEMKLSRSANETEEHKNKRLAAKQELMSVLRALEVERDVTTKLRDQIKFTFVPKMLHQQQALQEIIQEFTTALEKLSMRLGKPLLPLPEESEQDEVSNVTDTNGSHTDGTFAHSDNINPLVEKLDVESQKVSNAILAVSNNVERLRALVQASGDRTCFTVLSELVHTGGIASSPAVQADRARNQLQAAIGRSHRYGQIPGTLD